MQTIIRLITLLGFLNLVACGGGVGEVENSHPTQQAPISAPVVKTEYDEDNQLIISWVEQKGVQNYHMFLSKSEGFGVDETEEMILSKPPYVIPANSTQQKYYVKLKSYWAGNASFDSNVVSFFTPPVKPTNLLGTVTENNTIELNWDMSEGVDTYVLYRSTHEIFDHDNASVVANINMPYVDAEIDAGDTYYYWLVAIVNEQPSAYSSVRLKTPNNLFPIFNTPKQFSVNENSRFVKKINAEDKDGDSIEYSITSADDSGFFTIDSENGELFFISSPDFEAPNDHDRDNEYELAVRATDGKVNIEQEIKVTVIDVEEVINRPVANAGVDLDVERGVEVTLDGTKSFSRIDDSSLTYLWTAPNGINLSAYNVANPTFTVPLEAADEILTFTLEVMDINDVTSEKDTVRINVTEPVLVEYSVGGVLIRLNSGGIVKLNNNNDENLILFENGNFTFSKKVVSGNDFVISITEQPDGQFCDISEKQRVVTQEVKDIVVHCANTYVVGGSVMGMAPGDSIKIQDGADEILNIIQDSEFVFQREYVNSETYQIEIIETSTNQTCTLENAVGLVGDTDVKSVSINCESFLLAATPSSDSVTLGWESSPELTYTLYYSSDVNCKINEINLCQNSGVIEDVASPYKLNALTNGTGYYFTVQGVGTDTFAAAKTWSRPDKLVPNDVVTAIDVDTDGTTYIGGRFESFGVKTGGGVPVGKLSAKIYKEFPIVSGTVLTSVSDGAGGLYIGGDFTHVGNVERSHLAHILADGTIDLDWNPKVNDRVDALLYLNDILYVGGWFTAIDNQERGKLAAISRNGDLTAWDPNANWWVHAMTTHNNIIYIGGEFTSVAGEGRMKLAAIDLAGNLLDWDPSANIAVETLAISADGSTVYAGGNFNEVGGFPRDGVVAIQTSGRGEILEWNPALSFGVEALAVNTGKVYVGGWNNLVSIDSTGAGTLLEWNPKFDGLVDTITIDGDILYAGGSFVSVNSVPQKYVAAFNLQNETLLDWDPRINNYVYSIGIEDNFLYVGGRFTSIGDSIPRIGLAAIYEDGRLTPWNPSVNGEVYSIAIANDTIYLGGFFTQISNTERNYAGSVNKAGSLELWNPNLNGSVRKILFSGNTVYLAGSFTSVYGNPRAGLAALDMIGGGNLTEWKPSIIGMPTTLAIHENVLYVGGIFFQVNGVSRRYLAAIETEGVGVLTGWNPAPNNAVNTIYIVDDVVYVGGQFTTISGTSRQRLAAINRLNHNTVYSWSPESDGYVKSIVGLGDSIYIAGSFDNINNETRNLLAAANLNGDLQFWNPGLDKAPSGVEHIKIVNNKVYIVGDFRTVENKFSPFFGVLNPF